MNMARVEWKDTWKSQVVSYRHDFVYRCGDWRKNPHAWVLNQRQTDLTGHGRYSVDKSKRCIHADFQYPLIESSKTGEIISGIAMQMY
jgi:hypothetical protein